MLITVLLLVTQFSYMKTDSNCQMSHEVTGITIKWHIVNSTLLSEVFKLLYCKYIQTIKCKCVRRKIQNVLQCCMMVSSAGSQNSENI